MDLSYHPPDEPAVLTEKRRLTMTPPDDNGCYTIDWDTTFTAGNEDVLLDRTPIEGEPDGVSWGGYAGLSVRLAKCLSDWEVLDSEGRRGLDAHGEPARWLEFSFRGADGVNGGIAILDHPSNLRHPTPWFELMDPAVPFAYFGPAVLYSEPYVLPAGEQLTLRYRVLIHPGAIDESILETEWKGWCEE
jgi:hypothetical protein